MPDDDPLPLDGGAAGQPAPPGPNAPPAIEVPRGGGALRGIGEKLATSPATGTASLTVPIPVSSGRSGFGPELTLAYDSAAGNGPFGLGWALDLPAITRKTDKGIPRYNDATESDVYILSGAEDLVPMLAGDGSGYADRHRQGYTVRTYRPRVEGLFARIERWTDDRTGEIHWRSISRENITTLYGTSRWTRIADPADPASRVYQWLISESHDDKGNAIVYEYAAENDVGVDATLASERNRSPAANRYLRRIKYGNRTPRGESREPDWCFEVVFDYQEGVLEEIELDPSVGPDDQPRFVRATDPESVPDWSVRPDPFSSYRAGFEVRTYRRCSRVLMFHRFPELGDEPCLVRSTDFEYADFDYTRPFAVEDELRHQGSTRFASLLRAVTQSGYVRDPSLAPEQRPGGIQLGYLCRSMPPLELEYSRIELDPSIHDIDAVSLENLPAGLADGSYEWVDLDGEGVSGALLRQEAGWFYKPNEGGGRFGPLRTVATRPSLGGREQLLDLAGDGHLDVVAFDGSASGFFRRTEAAGWTPFRPFESLPGVDWSDPNLRLIDVTGDGLADVLLTEEDAFTWYPSQGDAGFGAGERTHQPWEEERGARVLLADSAQSIYLADMSGDGLSDLVRIRNGEVCYWPSHGYARFGPKVTMDNSPWLETPQQFDQARVQLADVDGSGTTDIVYLGEDGATVYFNQAGARWSEPRRITQTPLTTGLSSAAVVDLLGNGTACLVWSSASPADAGRPLRYIDLLGGRKPHLLVRTVNNLGAETRIRYASSTKFYLADKADGKPWLTRLPFPVFVVERSESYDRVSDARAVTRYAYHHGHFDGIEREFRGFGLVEQWDTEAIAALADGDPPAVDVDPDAQSSVPPALTRTWFHTGLCRGAERVSTCFAGPASSAGIGDYYREPGLSSSPLLNDSVLPDRLTPEEEREACRALKGSMLRQEVYARDGTALQDNPYTVTERSYAVRLVQRKAFGRHAIFFTHPREEISVHYERRPVDPRIRHSLTLEVDDFANVRKYAAIGYGRRDTDPKLAPDEQRVQSQDVSSYTERDVTNSVDNADDHRTPLPSEARTYELTGLRRRSERHGLSFDYVRAAVLGASSIPYEASPTPGEVQKRLIERVRTIYRRDDLGGPLPPGRLEALALPHDTYRLAFTHGLLSEVYGDRVSGALLGDECRFVRLDDDGDWWQPSGRVFYSPEPDASPAEELAVAREHFFVPRLYRDPFGSETTVAFDHDLLIRETCDALGNRMTVGERAIDPTQPPVRSGQDYRVMQPALIMDPNRNRTAVAFDALGLAVGSAMMGAPEDDPPLGDRLTEAFRRDLTHGEIARFFAEPRGPIAHTLLDQATTRIVYDPWRYRRERDPARKQPIYSATVARETHAGDPAPAGGPRLQVSFSYSDGFGRVIQKKSVADPSTEPHADARTRPRVVERWAATGWTIFNNKNKPVRRYEPFFTASHRFEPDVRVGVSPLLFYDPLDRVVATLHPDHSWQKLQVDPWSQTTWDVGDTVLVEDPKADPDVGGFFRRIPGRDYLPTWFASRAGGALGPEQRAAARQASVYAGTPNVTYSDSLGRAFLGVSHNRTAGESGPPVESFHRSRVTLDVKGQQLEVFDARERLVVRYRYNLLGTRIHQASMEAGERWKLADASARPLRSWDSRNYRTRTVYDLLRRPTEGFMRHGSGKETMVSRNVYGEGRPHSERDNLRTRAVTVHDQGGVASSDRYDFKGNLVRSRRQFARHYKGTMDWSEPVSLEADVYTCTMRYDALNRPVEVVEPDRTRVRRRYNDAGLLDHVEANLQRAEETTTLVERIEYNAKTQRTRVDYGNGVRTTYAHDPDTFRLTRVSTRRSRASDEPPSGELLQDLHYTYDVMGNVNHVRDNAQQTIFFRNARVEPSCHYAYDATYRLLEASGREHLGQLGTSIPYSETDDPRLRLAQPGDGKAVGRYRERYEYDLAGNLLSLTHRGSGSANPGWVRSFEYDEPSALDPSVRSNRLTSCTVGCTTETFSVGGSGYDAHGAMLALPHLPHLQWDFRNLLQMSQRQRVGEGEPAERTWYVYDASGKRVRKVTEGPHGEVRKERLYFGSFELFRSQGPNAVTRETLHVMDDKQRVALVETRTKGSDRSPAQLIRFQLAEPLGSVMLELDARARIISYEEYSAYGSTTYQAVSNITETPKRYRYTGKERDEETGFSYHGARYYAPWLCRWNTCDPAGLVDGANLYCYVSDRPTREGDPTGTQGGFDDPTGYIGRELSAETQGMIEMVAGGHAYVNVGTNTVEYSGPSGGVGGFWGGIVRAITLRLAPIEDNATEASLIGMEGGAALVPVLDPGERMVAGTTVTGQDTSRGWAAVQFGLDVIPFAAELHAVSAESRMASMESRMISVDASLLRTESEFAEVSHIGASGTGTLEPTVTNPEGRGDLCVADVGAHQANLRNPGQAPVTNVEMVQASGREVSRMDAPISNAGEASGFLNDAYKSLYESGRIAEPITASIPSGPLQPGEYLAVIGDEAGGHALHATVTDEVIDRQFISGGKFVSAEEAADLAAEGTRVVERPVYRVEYYDPQRGVCVQPSTPPTSYVRLQ